MLFLSSGTVDTTPRSATFSQQQGTTVYQLSVFLKESQGDELLSQGMGRDIHTQVEQHQPGGEVMSVPLMENSPRPGRARHEPSLCRTGTAGGQSVEEGEEGVKMKTDWFLKQSYRNREETQAAAHTDSHKHYIHSLVTLPAPNCRDHGSMGGHNSLPRAVLRRPCLGQGTLDRRTLSMYGEPVKQQQETKALEPQPRLRRPRSVCMLAAPGSVLPEVAQPSQGQCVTGGVQFRSRRAEMRAVDGLSAFTAPRPLVHPEVTPRNRTRSWKPRPVSMTVLELRKRGSEDDLDSTRGAGRDGLSFFKGGFWRLFSKTQQDKNKDRESEDSARLNKTDAPKSTLSSLKRSLSLRIRRTRPRDVEIKDSLRINSTSGETTVPSRPFSYLTGRTLPMPNEKVDDRTIQYIRYHSMGKVKVMEVPLSPSKLSKPVQEEPSIWQLIASRFRRKEQTYSSKCELQQFQSKSTRHPPGRNNVSQSVTIETVAGISAHKGQGKISRVLSLFLSFILPPFLPPIYFTESYSPCETRKCAFFRGTGK